LHTLAETISNELAVRVNGACEGKDVSAMHDKIMKLLPSKPLPSMRDVDKMVDELCDGV
jgi:hypothetical protein